MRKKNGNESGWKNEENSQFDVAQITHVKGSSYLFESISLVPERKNGVKDVFTRTLDGKTYVRDGITEKKKI